MIFLVGALVFVAVAGVSYVAAASARSRSDLATAIQPFVGGAPPARRDDAEERSLAESAIVRRAVEATASLARQRGALDAVERKLDQADVKLRPAEALFFAVFGGFVLTVLAAAVDPLFGLVVLVLALLGPPAALNALARRRRSAFTSLLPDTLNMLASSLRAGYSLPQAVAAVASESEEPMARELGRVVVEAELGRPLEAALDDVADRMGSPDFDWAVMAIKIQREVGGNLAELLTSVADTMVARERLRREVATLTAEGRLSAVFLLALPFVVAGFMWARNPEYLQVLFTDALGKALVVVALALLVAGYVWIRKIVEIEL